VQRFPRMKLAVPSKSSAGPGMVNVARREALPLNLA